MIASSIWKRKLKVQSPAPVVSSSPPASSSPHRRTQPQALRSSRCSSPVDRRGVTHGKVWTALSISKQEIHWLRPVLKHFRTIRSSGLEGSSQQGTIGGVIHYKRHDTLCTRSIEHTLMEMTKFPPFFRKNCEFKATILP